MNGDFLRPVQWYILYCMTPSGQLFAMEDTHTTVYTAPRHLESWFCYEGNSTFWRFISINHEQTLFEPITVTHVAV